MVHLVRAVQVVFIMVERRVVRREDLKLVPFLARSFLTDVLVHLVLSGAIHRLTVTGVTAAPTLVVVELHSTELVLSAQVEQLEAQDITDTDPRDIPEQQSLPLPVQVHQVHTTAMAQPELSLDLDRDQHRIATRSVPIPFVVERKEVRKADFTMVLGVTLMIILDQTGMVIMAVITALVALVERREERRVVFSLSKIAMLFANRSRAIRLRIANTTAVPSQSVIRLPFATATIVAHPLNPSAILIRLVMCTTASVIAVHTRKKSAPRLVKFNKVLVERKEERKEGSTTDSIITVLVVISMIISDRAGMVVMVVITAAKKEERRAVTTDMKFAKRLADLSSDRLFFTGMFRIV